MVIVQSRKYHNIKLVDMCVFQGDNPRHLRKTGPNQGVIDSLQNS